MPRLILPPLLLALMTLAGCGDAPKAASASRPASPAQPQPFEAAMRGIVQTRYRKDADEDFFRQVLAASVIQPNDLNGDGRPERIADIQYGLNSSGNRGFFVLAESNGGWTVVAELGGDTFKILKSADPASRFKDLETVWNNADGSHVRRVFRFNGSRYQEFRTTAK